MTSTSNTGPDLGALLFDLQTGLLIARDAHAAAELNIEDAELGRLYLHDLVPRLTKADQNAILPLSKKSRNISRAIRRPDGTELQARLNLVNLTGQQQDLLLLTYKPVDTVSTAILHRDALTGLPDRRELAGHYERWQHAAGKEEASLAMLFMDLNQFKQVNDQLGHTVGDKVLVALAERWQCCVRDGDLVVRYGGDEFVVLLTEIRSREEVELVIARLTEATSQPIQVDEEQILVGVTIGVALSDESSNDLEQLIIAADRDMYASKRP